MRRILEVLDNTNHPVGIVTKSALVLRDLDILARMAERDLVKVALSVTTLDATLARKMEPRAATPMRRLETLRRLSQAGVPTTVMVAPMIPAINDMEIERILEAGKTAGVKEAGYVLLRLPLEVQDLFREWLRETSRTAPRGQADRARYPGRKGLQLDLVQARAGSGPYAWMIGRRFQMTCEQLGLNERRLSLDISQFRRPEQNDGQLKLFAFSRAITLSSSRNIPRLNISSPARKSGSMPLSVQKSAPKNAARKNGNRRTPELPAPPPPQQAAAAAARRADHLAADLPPRAAG